VYYYYSFSALSDPVKLYNDLRWSVTRPQGFEAVVRVKCSEISPSSTSPPRSGSLPSASKFQRNHHEQQQQSQELPPPPPTKITKTTTLMPPPPPQRLPVPPNLSRKSSSASQTTKTRLKPPPLAPPPLLVQPNPPPPPVTKSPPTETVNLTPQPPLPLSPMFNHKPELTPKKLSSSFRRTLEHSVLLVLLPPSLLSFSTMTRMMRRKIWEEEQFRKGLGKRMDDGTSRVAVKASSVVPVVQSVQQQQQKFVYLAMPSVSGGPSIGGAIGVSQGLDAMISIPQQAEIAKKALQDNVRRLKLGAVKRRCDGFAAYYRLKRCTGTSSCAENEVEPEYQKPDYDDQPKAENHTGEVMDNNDVQAEEDPKWWDNESQNILDSQQLVEALCLCDDIFQSQSPNRDGNGNDGAGKGKLRLSDYAQLGPEDLKNAKTLSLIQQTLNLIHHQNSDLASLYVVFSAILFALC
ncbi:SUPPRESSOR OF GAMMA RESPONSE 1 isoform X2, partial [Fagus crenata]